MELRYALRSLRGTPWYSLTVIAVVGLSLALAVTVFAVVDGVVFKGLPYPDPDQLHLMSGPTALSVQDAREWSAAVPDVPLATLQSTFTVGVTTVDEARTLYAARVGLHFSTSWGSIPHRRIPAGAL